jgi:hypothetical protein
LDDDSGTLAMNRIGHGRELRPEIVWIRQEVTECMARVMHVHRLEDYQPAAALCPPLLISDVLVGCDSETIEVQESTMGGGDDSVAQFHRPDPNGTQQ